MTGIGRAGQDVETTKEGGCVPQATHKVAAPVLTRESVAFATLRTEKHVRKHPPLFAVIPMLPQALNPAVTIEVSRTGRYVTRFYPIEKTFLPIIPVSSQPRGFSQPVLLDPAPPSIVTCFSFSQRMGGPSCFLGITSCAPDSGHPTAFPTVRSQQATRTIQKRRRPR